MKHSIVIWDSSFRNFFHLIPSLAECDYDLSEVEIIFVEQRTPESASSVAQQVGVKSVSEVVAELSTKISIQVIYLEEDDSVPYHPGRLLNVGLKNATGDILSTMDADILVPPNFFTILDAVHERGNVSVNMHRASVPYPCGVSVDNWTNQIIDYNLLLSCVPADERSIPKIVGNKAPLISCKKEFWRAIEYYDEGVAWSTACTLFGQDVCRRFKILLGAESEIPLPIICVHPWHPTETRRQSKEAELLYSFQNTCISQSEKMHAYAVSARKLVQDQYFEKYQEQIMIAIQHLEMEMQSFTRK